MNPQELTSFGLTKSFGLRNDRLNNMSDAYIKEIQELEKALLHLLKSYKEIKPALRLSYDVYEWFLDDLVRSHEFMYYNYPVHHFLASYDDDLVRFLTEVHPIRNREDVEDYIVRLSRVYTQVDQVIEGLVLREKAGIVPPKVIMKMTKERIKTHLYQGATCIDGSNLPLYTGFQEKLRKIGLTAEEKKEFLDAALKEIEKSFIPAFLHLLDHVTYMETIATDDAGAWKFPRGDLYYQYVLRKETSTELTPHEIHEIGLREVSRIHAEMLRIFRDMGYPDESLGELLSRVIRDEGYYDLSTQEKRDTYLDIIRTILSEVTVNLSTVVDLHPSRELIVIGDPDAGVNFYVSGSLDGSRSGAFHVALRSSRISKFALKTVAYHEAIPGHHFQLTLAHELDLPFFRNIVTFNGFVEGWALYAEQLAEELGLFNDDPCGNIGRLWLELLRAVRLVADTGIHAKKWTREEARQYMNEVLGNPYVSEALGIPKDAIMSEVDRYIVYPGQAAGYMIGKLKILELRQKAMNELGDQFDIKEFHRVVLGNGSLPLVVLERVIEEYIDAKKEGVQCTMQKDNQL
ncbi:MAG: DUF885 domain-containing protein [Theionarchaea archaeon]|nr:DUF885 domain-containing protein [Theionarchaea archaeon]